MLIKNFVNSLTIHAKSPLKLWKGVCVHVLAIFIFLKVLVGWPGLDWIENFRGREITVS